MKIDATDLHRMAYNAAQFSDNDSSVGGLTLWSAGSGILRVWATDDYVCLRDETAVEHEPGGELIWGLELKQLKEMEKSLRSVEGQVFLDLMDDDKQLAVWQNEVFARLEVVDSTDELAPAVKIIHESEPDPEYDSDNSPFAIRLQRLTKFRLLKTPGDTEYPIDLIRGSNPQGVSVLLWKLGPRLRGVVGQVSRDYLTEYFADEREVLWY